jgi:hypothetical protein
MPQLAVIIKWSYRLTLLLSIVFLSLFYIYSSAIKHRILSDPSGKKFAVIKCKGLNCLNGVYFNLQEQEQQEVVTLNNQSLAVISDMIAHFNQSSALLSSKIDNTIYLYEVGNCQDYILNPGEKTLRLSWPKLIYSKSECNSICSRQLSSMDCNNDICRIRVRTDIVDHYGSTDYNLLNKFNNFLESVVIRSYPYTWSFI